MIIRVVVDSEGLTGIELLFITLGYHVHCSLHSHLNLSNVGWNLKLDLILFILSKFHILI
jgi:hypothetical protein